MRWKWNYWCTNGSTIVLASCFKKQMQLEFMFSSLSEKRNQSKLPSKLCVVIQIPPTKICNRKQEPGNERAEVHKAAAAPLARGWQLRGSALRLKSTVLLCPWERWPSQPAGCWGMRCLVVADGYLLERVGRGGISDSAISRGNPSPADEWRLNSSLTLCIVSWLSC